MLVFIVRMKFCFILTMMAMRMMMMMIMMMMMTMMAMRMMMMMMSFSDLVTTLGVRSVSLPIMTRKIACRYQQCKALLAVNLNG